MKKTITFILLLVITTLVSAQTVNIQGDPYTGNPYATITDAITASNDGDIILITGVHTESLSIQKSITLRGTDPITDIIQAAATAVSDGTGLNVINVIRDADTDVLTVTIENLGIRHGNADSDTNGGGINIDKVTGLLTLKNLIIENNHTNKNGGGLSLAGTNVDILGCSIQNNTSTLDGGGIITAPNNGAGVNSVVNIKQSLINSNAGRNGGGIYINGNAGFGNDYTIDVNLENSSLSNNTATSASGGAGGGGLWSKSATLTGGGTSGNINLQLVHATVYNNTHSSAGKNGFQFTGSDTNFSAFNSIVVSADDIAQKALNFLNTNTTNVVNCILGGLNSPPSAIIDDGSKNNQKGRTATQSGLTGALTDEGGNTLVLAINESSSADDFCSASTGITLPLTDQRDFVREGNPDAGAFEFGGTLSLNDFQLNSEIKIYPNPARGIVNIHGIENVKVIRVFSILGTLEMAVYNKNSINIANLKSGVHIIAIEKEGNIITRKLVVE